MKMIKVRMKIKMMMREIMVLGLQADQALVPNLVK